MLYVRKIVVTPYNYDNRNVKRSSNRSVGSALQIVCLFCPTPKDVADMNSVVHVVVWQGTLVPLEKPLYVLYSPTGGSRRANG